MSGTGLAPNKLLLGKEWFLRDEDLLIIKFSSSFLSLLEFEFGRELLS